MRKNLYIALPIWGLLSLLMVLLWSTPLSTGKLAGPDDYMRMVRVFALIDGDAGTSYAAPRLGLAGGSEIGWSRLVDWPLVFLQSSLEMFMPRMDAALLTTMIMPLVALFLFVCGAVWYARGLTDEKIKWGFLLLSFFFFWGLLRQFMPGRVDHHMWQAVLIVFAFGALVRIPQNTGSKFYPLLAGLFFATGLEIGADIIPPLALGTAWLGFIWLFRGQDIEKSLADFGAWLFGAGLLWSLFFHHDIRFFAGDCDTLSSFWLSLTLVVAVFGQAVYKAPVRFKDSLVKRFGLGAVLFSVLIAALYLSFPACFRDVYRIEDPAVREIWLSSVMEARGLAALWAVSKGAAVFFLIPALLVLPALAIKTLSASDQKDQIFFGGLAITVLLGTALTIYQVRTADMLMAMCAGLLPYAFFIYAALFGKVVQKTGLGEKGRVRLAAIFFFLCLSLLFVLPNVSKEHGKKDTAKDQICDVKQAAVYLNDIQGEMTIAADIDIGSELLFRTHHRALAAPYHRNQAGILAVYHILSAEDEARAHEFINASGVQILMLCSHNATPEKSAILGYGKGFAGDLLAGTVPLWLSVEEGGQTGGYDIFLVLPEN